MTLAKAKFSEALPISVHGTSLEIGGKGVLITGPSGSGKSSLALQLMALGAGLIADDATWLEHANGAIQLARPPTAPERVQIEARGFGVLAAEPARPAPLVLIIDMSQTENQRLPEIKSREIAEVPVRTIHKVDNPAFPAMIWQYFLLNEADPQ